MQLGFSLDELDGVSLHSIAPGCGGDRECVIEKQSIAAGENAARFPLRVQ